MKNEAIIDAIYARRSIRKFTDEAVSDEHIDILLKAAMAAPSATNAQPWRFVVTRDPKRLAAIRKEMPAGKINAPLAILVCADLTIFKRPITERFWTQDCSAATQNILLAAVGLGLGTVWCGVHPVPLIEKRMEKLLDLPANVKVLNVIYIGHPAEEKEARTQYDANKVFKDRYGEPWQD
ncbi:MAG TPA: nitroreductase family protein [Anaerolineaceae bacterium]|nr:nitroreductase family protein [Anaerolineaceae bacterium]